MNVEARIERLLDQLENSNLTQVEIDKIKSKVAILQSLEQ